MLDFDLREHELEYHFNDVILTENKNLNPIQKRIGLHFTWFMKAYKVIDLTANKVLKDRTQKHD